MAFPVTIIIREGIPISGISGSYLKFEVRAKRGFKRFKHLLCAIRGHHAWVDVSLMCEGVVISISGICNYCGATEGWMRL